MIKKALDDALRWSEVNPKGEMVNIQDSGRGSIWKQPCPGFMKCNLGYLWSTRDKTPGASWVLRDHYGKVLMHSRRSFSGYHSKCEVATQSWMWTMESMHNMKF